MTYEQLQSLLLERDHVFFDTGDYNLNIVGVRRSRTVTDLFDDTLYVAYRSNSSPVLWDCTFTTKPGKAYIEEPPLKGCAVLKPGQYRSAYTLGIHKESHRALVQSSPVTVYRDVNGDALCDYTKEETGLFGINIHWSSRIRLSTTVGTWSAGCQVGAGPQAYLDFIGLLDRSATLYGKKFSYTLLDLSDA